MQRLLKGQSPERHAGRHKSKVLMPGMGSTGWLKSLLTGAVGISRSALTVLPALTRDGQRPASSPKQRPETSFNVKTEFAWDANFLLFTVREPFPTRTTGVSLVFGRVTQETPLTLESHMAEHGVIFSDGIEQDSLEFNSGTRAVIDLAECKGVLVA